MEDVDIFVGNTLMVDSDVYQLWLNGYTAHEAVLALQRRGVIQQYGVTQDMLLSDTQDHYRTFAILEPLLKEPKKMSEQLELQITPDLQKMLIEKYYDFDTSVMREILGKKLSSRFRSSLEDVSEKSRVPLRSCRRQFDNVKRVFKIVEEMLGSLVENIKLHFLMSHTLAKQYAAIVFIANSRFETSKKKLCYVTFHDYTHCANQMILNWSYSSKDCQSHQDMDQDLDREFLITLRDLKPLTDHKHTEEHKSYVTRCCSGQLTAAATADVDSNFKVYSKALINMAYGLNHSKELKDLFVDIVERIIEPSKAACWSIHDMKLFLKHYQEAYLVLDFFTRQHPNLVKSWDRYMATMSECIIQLYHN